MHGAARIQPAGRRLKLWWAQGRGEADPLAAPSADRPINLFEPKDRGQMFTAGGLFTPSGELDEEERDDLHRMMAALSLRMAADHPASRQDNPRLPSGYTYFLQFIAHDMVDTVLWPTVARSVDLDESRLRVQMRNGRAVPLALATLYGPGPDASPAAYEFGERQRLRHGHVPRLRFRLGPKSGEAPERDGFCPHRDIARARTEPNLVCDRGLPERLRPAPGASPSGRPYLTEALVADPRNDSHPLISQFTVLFKLLHNQIIDLLEHELKTSTSERRSRTPDVERVEAYRLFQCARSLTTIIYHGIIANDLTPRIVDPRVLDSYIERSYVPFSELRSAPLEFSFGAFRFAHALIRDSYRVNLNNPPQHMINGLSFSSSRRPANLPLTGFWMVDWSLFFDLGDGRLENFSKCISPLYPRALTHEDHFMPKDKAVDAVGVADRDMLSSSYAGLLSVPAIIAGLSDRFPFIEPFETFATGIKQWLRKHDHWRDAPARDDKTYVDRLTSDPPLPFFILYEAQHARAPVPADGPRPEDSETRTIGGRHLGPIGSAILCETIFSAMQRSAPVEGAATGSTRNGRDHGGPRESSDQRTAARYRACLDGFYSDPALVRGVLDKLPPISSMPQLIAFLKAAQMDEASPN